MGGVCSTLFAPLPIFLPGKFSVPLVCVWASCGSCRNSYRGANVVDRRDRRDRRDRYATPRFVIRFLTFSAFPVFLGWLKCSSYWSCGSFLCLDTCGPFFFTLPPLPAHECTRQPNLKISHGAIRGPPDMYIYQEPSQEKQWLDGC